MTKTYRKGLVFIILLTISLSLAGCQLAVKDLAYSTHSSKLVGAFVTTEEIDTFDVESYLSDQVNKMNWQDNSLVMNQNSDSSDFFVDDNTKYEKRLYATVGSKTIKNEETGLSVAVPTYDFGGIDGSGIFVLHDALNTSSMATNGVDYLTDVGINVTNNDEGYSNEIYGTIYICSDSIPTDKDLNSTEPSFTIYINPIYQDSEGKIYVLSGDSISTNSLENGATLSQTLNESTTTTINDVTTKYNMEVKITIQGHPSPKNIQLIQMDQKNQIISSKEYVAGTLPTTFTPDSNTEYIIIESYDTASESKTDTDRMIFDKSDTSFDTFYAKGIYCIKQNTSLIWESK